MQLIKIPMVMLSAELRVSKQSSMMTQLKARCRRYCSPSICNRTLGEPRVIPS